MNISKLAARLAVRLHARVAGAGRDRGDVPGWVLVTVMTAGLVAALWLLAEDMLQDVMTDAVDSVTKNL